jgi:hypothetical protein
MARAERLWRRLLPAKSDPVPYQSEPAERCGKQEQAGGLWNGYEEAADFSARK